MLYREHCEIKGVREIFQMFAIVFEHFCLSWQNMTDAFVTPFPEILMTPGDRSKNKDVSQKQFPAKKMMGERETEGSKRRTYTKIARRLP